MRSRAVSGRSQSDLIGSAEDVSVVLLEAAHARQPRQRAAQLVPVQHSEIGQSQRQIAERMQIVTEHDTMPCKHDKWERVVDQYAGDDG
jgi:hypothetical protein